MPLHFSFDPVAPRFYRGHRAFEESHIRSCIAGSDYGSCIQAAADVSHVHGLSVLIVGNPRSHAVRGCAINALSLEEEHPLERKTRFIRPTDNLPPNLEPDPLKNRGGIIEILIACLESKPKEMRYENQKWFFHDGFSYFFFSFELVELC